MLKRFRKILHAVASGYTLLRDPHHNKGLAFTEKERKSHYLVGLLPPTVVPQDLQVRKLMHNLRQYKVPLQKYMVMMGLQAFQANIGGVSDTANGCRDIQAHSCTVQDHGHCQHGRRPLSAPRVHARGFHHAQGRYPELVGLELLGFSLNLRLQCTCR